MRKSNYLTKAVCAAFMSFAVVTSTISITTVATKDVKAATDASEKSRYQLVWSDEFNGTTLNTNNWTALEGNGGNNPGWGNNELQYYTSNEENLKVAGGALQITARKSDMSLKDEVSGATCKYTSARLTTTQKQNFKYGKVEARIKLPAVNGLWPAFWMMGDDEPQGWPFCGEIDILETWNTAQLTQGAFHWNAGTTLNHKYTYRMRQAGGFGFENFDKTQYHVYGLEWDADTIIWSVDGFEYWTFDVASDPDKAQELTKHYYILLNMAVGGNLTQGVAIDEASLPATMYVDYVRVYQLTNSDSQYTKKWTEQSAVDTHIVKLTNGKNTRVSTVYDGETLLLPKLSKKGYIFKGYFASNGKEVTCETRITSDTAIKAKWTKVKVKKAKIATIKPAKKRVTLKMKTKGGAKGYQVQYSTKKKAKGGKKKIIEGSSVTIPRLKSGETYYFKARAYKVDSMNKKVYGKWSKVKTAKVK